MVLTGGLEEGDDFVECFAHLLQPLPDADAQLFDADVLRTERLVADQVAGSAFRSELSMGWVGLGRDFFLSIFNGLGWVSQLMGWVGSGHTKWTTLSQVVDNEVKSPNS